MNFYDSETSAPLFAVKTFLALTSMMSAVCCFCVAILNKWLLTLHFYHLCLFMWKQLFLNLFNLIF